LEANLRLQRVVEVEVSRNRVEAIWSLALIQRLQEALSISVSIALDRVDPAP